VVSFTPRPLYPQGMSPLYPMGRKLGGIQKSSGRGGAEKNSQSPQESNPRTPIVRPIAQRYTDQFKMIIHEIYTLHYSHFSALNQNRVDTFLISQSYVLCNSMSCSYIRCSGVAEMEGRTDRQTDRQTYEKWGKFVTIGSYHPN
jgi:hypothetical protein